MGEKIWRINTPKVVYSGENSILKLKEILATNSVHRPFVVFDEGLRKTAFSKLVNNILTDYHPYYWQEFTTNPTSSQGDAGSKCFQENKGNTIIAIGGGSAIDLAKYISLLNDFPLFIAIPTSCGTGAECSPYAIIKDENSIKKKALEHELFIPHYVILDPSSLLSLSKEMIAATAMDTLAHALEVHISRNADSLVRISTRGSLHTLFKYLEGAIFTKDLAALEALQNTAFTARLLYPGTGLSIAHSLAHPLGAYTDWHHGIIIALLLAETLTFNRIACPELIEEINAILSLYTSDQPDIVFWIKEILTRSEIFTILNNSQELIKQLPINKILADAMQSSNILSNPREIESAEELRNVLVNSLEKL